MKVLETGICFSRFYTASNSSNQRVAVYLSAVVTHPDLTSQYAMDPDPIQKLT
jgi:hypothetical protein